MDVVLLAVLVGLPVLGEVGGVILGIPARRFFGWAWGARPDHRGLDFVLSVLNLSLVDPNTGHRWGLIDTGPEYSP